MSKPQLAAIDTNILLLVMFASMKRDPGNDKRLSRYNCLDVSIIEGLVCSFDGLITTPNVLTEVSNQLKGYEEYQWFKECIIKSLEIYIPSRELTQELLLERLGLTDVGFLNSGFQNCCVVTDDRELNNYLSSRDQEVVYYSEYREEFFRWMS